MQPESHKKKWLIITITAGVLALLIAGGYITYTFLSKPATTQKYQFIFDEAKAPGWWAAANFWPNLDEYTGNQVTEKDLSVVGRNIFQGTSEQDMSGNCFVMFNYFDQPINIAQKLKEKEDSITFNDPSLSLRRISVESLSIETLEGTKSYQWHNYDIVGNNGSDFMRGTGVGYVELSNGYLFINSVCKEATQLESVRPVLDATRFAL